MINPFKRTYHIIELKNDDGKSKIVVTYTNAIERFFFSIGYPIDTYIDKSADLHTWFTEKEHSSVECAKQAIEKHKKALENSKYKKTIIHYV